MEIFSAHGPIKFSTLCSTISKAFGQVLVNFTLERCLCVEFASACLFIFLFRLSNCSSHHHWCKLTSARVYLDNRLNPVEHFCLRSCNNTLIKVEFYLSNFSPETFTQIFVFYSNHFADSLNAACLKSIFDLHSGFIVKDFCGTSGLVWRCSCNKRRR